MTWAPLLLLVALAWAATAGFLRKSGALDRLHAASLLATTGPALLALAALLDGGLSDRFGKLVLLAVVLLLGGAVSSHVIARALRLRGSVVSD